jgi:hypothetical protein
MSINTPRFFQMIDIGAKPQPLELIIDEKSPTSQAIAMELRIAHAAPELLATLLVIAQSPNLTSDVAFARITLRSMGLFDCPPEDGTAKPWDHFEQALALTRSQSNMRADIIAQLREALAEVLPVADVGLEEHADDVHELDEDRASFAKAEDDVKNARALLERTKQFEGK